MSQFSVIPYLMLCGLAVVPALAGELNSSAQDAANLNPIAGRPPAEYRETLERPLFASNRRPMIQEKPAMTLVSQPVPPALSPSPVLAGVVSMSDGMIALISLPENEKFVQARVGDEVNNWKIIEIDPQRMVVEQGARRIELSMFRAEEVGVTSKTSISGLPDLDKHASRNFDRLAASEKLPR